MHFAWKFSHYARYWKNWHFFSISHAKAILEILDDIFEDVPDCKELMEMVDDVCQMELMESFWDERMYFDSSDSDSEDPDRILTEELENL